MAVSFATWRDSLIAERAALAIERHASFAPTARHAAWRTPTCEAIQPATAQLRDRRRPATARTHMRPHPPSRPDPRCKHRCIPAGHQRPRSPGIARRSRSPQAKAAHHTAPISGPETSQRRTRRSLKRLVRDPPLARAWLSARQLPDDSPEPLDANTTGRRGRRQLVVITAADELKPALAAGPRAALVLPHRSAADAARDRQATGRPHGITISPAPAAASWPMPGPARSCPARPWYAPSRRCTREQGHRPKPRQ